MMTLPSRHAGKMILSGSGRCTRRPVLQCWQWTINELLFGYHVSFCYLLSVTQEPKKVPILQLIVPEISNTSWRIGQDAGERCGKDCSGRGPCPLQQAVSSGKGIGPLNTFMILYKFRMRMVAFLTAIWKGDIMFSIDMKDAYFKIPLHIESRLYL